MICAEAKPMADRDLFDIEGTDAKQRAIAAARALRRESDIPLAEVARWLESWRKPDELPPPPWNEDSPGSHFTCNGSACISDAKC